MTLEPWTIQSLIDANMAVTAYCNVAACAHIKTLNLDELRDRLGPDAPARERDMRPRLRCEVCQSKDIGLIYSPDSRKTSGMGQNLCANAKRGRVATRDEAVSSVERAYTRRIVGADIPKSMHWFSAPVFVRELTTGYTSGVRSVESAIEHMRTWPIPKGSPRSLRKAYEVCYGVADRSFTVDDARAAFEAAAKAAGVFRLGDD